MILNCQKDIPVSIIVSGENNVVLFRGIVRGAEVFWENGLHYIEMEIVTASELLDRKKNQRSFQDRTMTYRQIVERVLEPYAGAVIRFTKEAENILQEPLVQYGETDWEFLLRLGSRLHLPLYADCFTGNSGFDFGMREGRKVKLEMEDYRVGISSRYYEEDSGIAKGEFLYYIIVSDKAFMIGDYIDIGKGSYPIFKRCIALDREELRYTYWIGNPGNWYIPEIMHERLAGMEFTGTVIQTREEKVKVRFDIDGEQGGAEYEWDWMPVSGNIMYSMPEPNTSVRVCFGSETTSEGVVSESIRENGSGMPGEQERTFATGAGKRINLHPSQISFHGKGGETGISDQEKIYLSSAGSIRMTSVGTIKIKASDIRAETPLEINMYRSEGAGRARQKDIKAKGTRSNPPTGGSDSGFTMNFEFNGLSKSGVLCGYEFIKYRPFLDAPEEIPIDESAFDWGALVGNVLGGLAIVAGVTALAVYGASVVFSGGATATVAPWVVGGLTALCGGAFVFGQARADYEVKKVSKFSNYAAGGIINSLKGTFTAAAFCMVPYAAESVVYMAVPSVTGGMAVGGMFISTEELIALTGLAGYTVTFSDIAVKINDAQADLTGTNALSGMLGEENYQDIKGLTQTGSSIILMAGLSNPNFWVKNQGTTNTNIGEIAAYDNSEGGTDSKIRPSNTYDIDAKPSGTSTKITDKMDDATRRSLIRENEAAETIARNGYNIEQNPIVEGTTRNPDYRIEGKIFDCYSPAENTKIRNIASTIEEKVIEKGQTNCVVLNLEDWKGNINELVNQLNEYPIEGLEEVLVVQDGKVISIYP